MSGVGQVGSVLVRLERAGGVCHGDRVRQGETGLVGRVRQGEPG